MRAYVVVALLMVGISTSRGKDICAIDCTHGSALTADPVNCKNYYICYSPYDHSDFPFVCEGNKFFDILTHTCIEIGYECTPECEKCSFDCAAPVLGKIANPVDCHIYYDCKTGSWFTCPIGKTFYDGNICQSDKQHCCACKSQCSTNDVINHLMVPDYRNCTNFYLCVDIGFPDQNTHGHCPSGNFDPQSRTCNPDAPCIQPCI